MALTFPPYDTISEQARAELRRQKPEIDPTVFGSFARAFMDSAAALAYSNNLVIRDLSLELFPQTATGDFLAKWGGYEDLERNPASSSTGFASWPGTVGGTIPVATSLTSSGNLEFQADAVAVVETVSQSISTLTRSGSIVTGTTPSDHSLATGLTATIADADQSDYNGDFEITVTARDKFTYEIGTTPTTPATGTITVSGDYAIVQVTSVDTGSDVNLDGGAVLTLATSITNVDDSGFAQFDGLSGGADIETDEDYRDRIFLSRSTIEGVFTANQVELAAKSVSGNTRAFVVTPTLSVAEINPSPGDDPSPGQVFVYILRDNDANIIPTQTVLDTTKQAVIDEGKLPANSSEADVFLFAPDTQVVDFTFTSLNPDTSTMQTAVIDQLEAFFLDKIDFEEDVLEAAYLGEIQNTQDLTTGDVMQSFALSTPSGDVAVAAGAIAILGDVTFP